jgi:hypothetical protein
MSKVTFSLSMSLDGFVAGPHDEIDPLHDWLFAGEHPSRSGFGRMTEPSRALLDARIATLGGGRRESRLRDGRDRLGDAPPPRAAWNLSG